MTIFVTFLAIYSQNVWKMAKKTIFELFWDILDSPGIENVGNDNFRHFLSRGSPKYSKIAQKLVFFGHVPYILATYDYVAKMYVIWPKRSFLGYFGIFLTPLG